MVEDRRAYMRAYMQARRQAERAARDTRECMECGAAFEITQGNKKYCTPECSRKALLRCRRDKEYQPPISFCMYCSEQIAYKSGRRRFCSSKCQLANAAKTAKWRAKGLQPDHGLDQVCGICGTTERQLVIDHDHACCSGERACGKCVRGLLCRPCNVALGMFKERPDLLRRAAQYLEDKAFTRLAGSEAGYQ